LRTSQRCQGIAHHPVTGEAVWFNQAHLFHLSALDADTREVLLEIVGEAYVPRHVYYGDGSPISDLELDHIRAVLAQHTVIFPWREGDVLMLDNMLSAHARLPFKGPRKVMVAMAQGHGVDFI
jgi:alpha-ketoglutarate-dependent taurine dioxygenase